MGGWTQTEECDWLRRAEELSPKPSVGEAQGQRLTLQSPGRLSSSAPGTPDSGSERASQLEGELAIY